ncbi:KTSC domain-containing protein [Faecalibacter macacae]|uniref:KTSC domain-containing protein n=1 Tax=Faecalibacter macacae TaxID=1859289 RepID=A0A3L9M3B9_9FLAO|nr:KTSC domain-containing protein [Faecalibacter macacae]RLZ07013.1 KTSC domain-containing protein [Faecalibacter macacae]
MKRVIEYRRLLGVDKDVTLKQLKTIYRNAMKDSHPDKFVDDEAGRIEAEERSKVVIEAYHFLVSINNETHEKLQAEYNETFDNYIIQDFYLEKQVLTVIHLDGTAFEYLGVPKNVFGKMCNADSASRFAKRHIYGKFLFRKAGKPMEA